MSEEEERAVTSRDFSAYGHPLEMVTSFKYLGQVISAMYNDWSELFRNMVKAREVWRSLSRILIREGVEPQVYGFLFKAMVQ